MKDYSIRLEHAIDSIGAKRVVLDSIESLFAGVTDAGILRLENWKKMRVKGAFVDFTLLSPVAWATLVKSTN